MKLKTQKRIEKYIKYLINWLQKEVLKSNAKGVVFGLSGGIDSAVMASIVKQAFPNNHLALWIDIESSKHAYDNSQLVSKTLGLNLKEINLTQALKEIKIQTQDIQQEGKEFNYKVDGNIKSRLRMTTIYEFAQIHEYLVLGTSNLDEYHLGYFTKWGDAAADLYPLIGLTKNKIYKIARVLNVNKEILETPPSADLYPDQTDEKEMGLTYKEIDRYLEGRRVSKDIRIKVKSMYRASIHKRRPLPKKPKDIYRFLYFRR